MPLSLAAQGLSYARAGKWVGCVKSTVGKWMRKAPLTAPELPAVRNAGTGRVVDSNP